MYFPDFQNTLKNIWKNKTLKEIVVLQNKYIKKCLFDSRLNFFYAKMSSRKLYDF